MDKPKDPPENADFQFQHGLVSLFKLILSAQPDFTFTASNDLMRAFPYEDCHLEAHRNEHETCFALIFDNDKAH